MNLKFYILFLLLSFGTLMASANNKRDSLSVAKRDSVFLINPSANQTPWIEEPSDILADGILPTMNNNDSIRRYIELARSVIAKVRSLQNFITNIDEASKVELPVGISREIGGLRYDIAIHAIRLKPGYAELDVFMEFEVPQNKQVLTFMAKGIKFTKKSGIVGDAKLQLLTDYAINLNGDKSQLILRSKGLGKGTYVVMDCDGYKEMSLDASVKFSRDLLRPEKPDGTQGEGNVQTDFSFSLTDWNDLVVQLSLPAFQVTGLNGFGFSVKDAVFDFSDVRNAPAVVFPKDYKSTQFLPDNQNLWRGFYLRQLTVSIPGEFKSKNGAGRTTFMAENVLIDNMGLSGVFTGKNLISRSQGNMSGWAFSLDSLGFTLQANQLVDAGFNGGIVIPIGKEDRPFSYKAIINPGGNYVFNVKPDADMTFPLWGAGKVEIYEASYLDIKVVDGKFLPKASLHGRMNVEAKLSAGGQGVSLADISFEALELQTVKPFIKVGTFSFGSEALQQKMAGFPISIQDIGLRSMGDDLGLDFTLKLNLTGSDGGAFAADAGLTLVGSMDSTRGWQSWKYKTIQVNEIGVDIDGGSFKINGRLIFYRNDLVYGDGFNGTVKAEFTPGLKVTGTAIFGSVSGLRYWYADAMINFPTGIPIFTGVGIYGFGGGIYYGMKMDNQGLGSDLGKTASGVIYVPYEKAGLGLKAVVSLGSYPKPEAFNADVTFEIAFFKGGGVRYIAFGGNGYLITPGLDLNLDKLKGVAGKMAGAVRKMEGQLSDATKGFVKADDGGNSALEIFGAIGEQAGQKGQISAKVLIDYDFENRVLHGSFEVFINVAGGIIKGVGPSGRAGWAVLHFAPGEWYVYAGTPDDRVGVALGIGSVRVAVTSYFMVGTKILGSPPPPPEVTNILKGDFDYMKDLNAIGKGGGFAFGASLSMSTGDLSFLMFYGHFAAGLGFDIMLKDYGEVYCKGSNKRLGINGWYANGQSYAYFDGEIGIRVKVFGKKKSVSILSIAAAALMQAQLPNPVWVQGTVGGRFSVLGGLVKGNCQFQVTLGEKCEIQRSAESLLEDIKVITEITPAQDEKDVNVFTSPQVVFSMPIEKTFEIVDLESGSDERRNFRVKLDYLKVTSEGRDIVGTPEWNEDQDVLAFHPYEVLPSKKTVKVAVQVSFEEQVNGRWAVVVAEGKKVVQNLENTFGTDVAPPYIPLSNVEYSYPLISQANFYRNESADGYIKLRQAQPYLFEAGPEWKQKGRFTSDDGAQSLFDYAYTYSTNRVTFKMPSDLKAGQTYQFELVNLPAQKGGAVDRNVTTGSEKVGGNTEGLDLEIKTRKAEGSIETLQEKSIFNTAFRSSQYARFQDKLASQQISGVYRFLRIPWYTHYLGASIVQEESFDKAEILGTAYTGNKPLITLEADLTDNTYYNSQVYPLVYEGYPLDGDIKVSRDISVMGFPPVKAVSIYQDPQDIELVEGVMNKTGHQLLRYQYDLPMYMIADFGDIQSKVVERYVTKKTVSDRVRMILENTYPILSEGTYAVKVIYHLPGMEQPQYVRQMTFTLKTSEN